MEPDDLPRSWRDRLLDAVWPDRPTTWRGLREWAAPEVFNWARLTVATVLGYLLGQWLIKGPIDLTGALTALLVVQASARGSLLAGLGRVAAVLTGVGLAMVFATRFGLAWWTLGVLIASALLIAKVFRFRSASLEVPISAMLILGSAGRNLAAETRVELTLVGTIVGVILPLLWPPAIPTRPAARAVRDVGTRLGRIFVNASEYADRRPLTQAVAAEWFSDTRRVNDQIGTARHRIREIREYRAWNARAFGTADVGPILATGLDALERCTLAARAMFLVVSDNAPRDDSDDGAFSGEIRQAFAVVLADVGSCVEAYADLVEAEAGGDEKEAQERFAATIELLDETRAMLTDLMLVDPGAQGPWLMHATVLKAIDQILLELDLETHLRRREAWRWTQLGLKLPGGRIGPVTHNPLTRWSNRRLRRRAEESSVAHADVYQDFHDSHTTEVMTPVPPPVVAPDTHGGRLPPPPGRVRQ